MASGLGDVLELVAEFRKSDAATPIVLMGYANPIEAMGTEKFIAAAKAAGVDGVIVVDYPPEECEQFAALAKKAGIDPIFLLAPTSTDKRIEQVGRVGSGYLYYVSLRGITGAANIDFSEISSRIPRIRAATHLPIGVGFGIRDARVGAARGAVGRRGGHRQPHHPGDRSRGAPTARWPGSRRS